jgi:hypothetical protein
VQAGAVGQSGVDPRRRVVQPTSRGRGQPDGEPADGVVVGKPHLGQFQSGSPVDPDVLGPVDKHVGHTGCPEQRLERTGAGQFVDGVADGEQHVVVTQQPAGLLPDHGGDHGPGGCPRLQCQAGAHAVQQRGRGHDARAAGGSAART